MDEEVKKIDLNKINSIPKEEFKKQMLNWIEDRDLSKVLQSKLRKDLFDNFNKTAIGRKITSEFHSNYRLFLSPIFLALHALIAEFLYSQNCHFSLSVFSSEVPYKHILPNFEKCDHFRFSDKEIIELLEALGIKVANNDQICLIQKSYHSGTNEGKPLLLCLIKFCLNLMTVKQTTKTQVNKKTPDNRNVLLERPMNSIDKKHNNNHVNNVNTASEQIKYMNVYMKGLGKQIKHLSSDLQILQRRTTKQQQHQRNKRKTIKNPNKSSERRAYDNLKLKERNKQQHNISFIINNIDKLTSRMDWCVNHFENITKLIKDNNNNKNFNDNQKENHDKHVDIDGAKQLNEKLLKKYINLGTNNNNNNNINQNNLPSYGDWVKDLKISNHGKKFMQRLENSLYKTIEKEKEKLEKLYHEKLEDQKAILRLHYKQKYKEQKFDVAAATGVASETVTSIQQKDILNDLIDRKLKLLDDREHDINEKVNKLREEIKLYENEKLKFIENNQKLEKIKQQNVGDATRKIRNSLAYHSAYKIDIRGSNEIQSTNTTKIVPLTELNVKSHDNIENIVYEAQKRMHDLEMESELLENSFQNYLKKYYIDNNKNNYCYKNIIDNYNCNKNLLALKKLTATSTIARKATENNSNFNVNQNAINFDLLNLNDNSYKNYSYENPFKKLSKSVININNNSTENIYHYRNNIYKSFNQVKTDSPPNEDIKRHQLSEQSQHKLHTEQQFTVNMIKNVNLEATNETDCNKKLFLSHENNSVNITIGTVATSTLSIADGVSSDLKNISLDDDDIIGLSDEKLSSDNEMKNSPETIITDKKNVHFNEVPTIAAVNTHLTLSSSDELIEISTGDKSFIINQENDDFWN